MQANDVRGANISFLKENADWCGVPFDRLVGAGYSRGNREPWLSSEGVDDGFKLDQKSGKTSRRTYRGRKAARRVKTAGSRKGVAQQQPARESAGNSGEAIYEGRGSAPVDGNIAESSN